MANHKSAAKRNRQTIKRTARHKAIRSEAKTAAHKAFEAIKANPKAAVGTLVEAISTLAKTASKGSIPKRRASRKISRLYKAANKATAGASTSK